MSFNPILVQKQIFGPKKSETFWFKNNLGLENFRSKSFWSLRSAGSKIHIKCKEIGINKILGLKKFIFKHYSIKVICRSKTIFVQKIL